MADKRRPWDEIRGTIPDGWEPVPSDHPGGWHRPGPRPAPPSRSAPSLARRDPLPPREELPHPGSRRRADYLLLHDDVRVALKLGELWLGALHAVEGNALRAILTETNAELGSPAYAYVPHVWAEGSGSTVVKDIRHEIALSQRAAAGTDGHGVVGDVFSLRVHRWSRQDPGAARPLAAGPPRKPGLSVGVRPTAEAKGTAEPYAADGRQRGVGGDMDPWNRGVGVALHWALGELSLPPFPELPALKDLVIGEGPPDMERLAAESRTAQAEWEQLRQADGDMIRYVQGARDALAWLTGAADSLPPPRGA